MYRKAGNSIHVRATYKIIIHNMKVELFSFWNDREYCQWWIVILDITFYGRDSNKNYCLFNIQKDRYRWIVEILFIRWDLLCRKLKK